MLTSELIRYTAMLFGITSGDMAGRTRRKHHVRARFAFYAGLWLRAELQGRQPSYTGIGYALGRDHSTVCSGMAKANALMETDAAFMEAVIQIATIKSRQFEEACKSLLQEVSEASQQLKDTEVSNPETIEARINAHLAKVKAADIKVYWDGDVIERGKPEVYNVYFREDDTGCWVADTGAELILYRTIGSHRYEAIDAASDYEGLAKLLQAFAAELLEKEAA